MSLEMSTELGEGEVRERILFLLLGGPGVLGQIFHSLGGTWIPSVQTQSKAVSVVLGCATPGLSCVDMVSEINCYKVYLFFIA